MMNFNEFLDSYKPLIDKELEKIIPRKITTSWLRSVFGRADYEYDSNAIQHNLLDPIRELLDRGGKRWRPVLMLLCCRAVGGDENMARPFVVLPELLHNGTLIIDDLEDNSELRRSKPCIHRMFGIDVAVNAGNFLYFFSLIVIEQADREAKLKIFNLVTDEMIKLHLGQGTDIFWHNSSSSEVDEKKYLQMCAFKTGTLARLAARLGVILGKGSLEQQDALGRFAESIGIAFQIQDDYLNLTTPDTWTKEFGEDISEGKISLLVIHALKSDKKQRLLEILGMHTKAKDLIDEAVLIIKESGAFEYASKQAKQIVVQAWKNVESLLPESDAKNKLRELADFLVQRNI